MIATPRFAIEQALRTVPFSMSADHVHQAHEIYYLLAGERYYYINQRVYALQKGDLIWISKHDFHRTSNKGSGSHERILINFDEEFAASPMTVSPSSDQNQPLLPEKSFLLRPSAEEQCELEHLFQQMLDEYYQEHAYRQLYLQSLLLQLLIRIRRIQSTTADTIAPERSEKQQRVYSVIAYLHAHYAESLSLDQLAEHFYISSTYLCRIFKQTTGFTLVEYLQDVRVQQARAYLRETNWKVTSIAEKTGFDSIAHFGRVFKHLTGHTPLQYRKKYKKE
ncbi:helix-turn-helix transcriptional regulator [Paenibacillus polymyxa]|uniref:Helix-turn-helix transcriptional regulator n=1 Tax=Paenibacillus polymyxa TaxID=1406 RepID=A0A8I1LSB9_PAEPO|nr:MULTISPECIES: AraC family transcriptional regulator [Paenibacillus]KAF6571798.1 helix-turn-helix transcriptional regulator [Paenibacillus sp. EKM206P]KAF6586511.1 helix-turn-helix transcriptional regulator [Paenibacillus sp. EKM205P]MBM0635155.1 helix-turn-helix transcriptional regulator [Paenibacillus polymyxa]